MADPTPVDHSRAQSLERLKRWTVLCDAHAQALHAGQRTPLSTVLRQVPEGERPELLERLLAVDWELRTKSGELPTLQEYVSSLPEYETLIGSCLAKLQAGDTQHTNSLSATIPWNLASGSVSTSPTNLPARIGDYQILGEIARGGMGVVYKAQHLQLKRLAAVKLIRSGEFADEQEIRRFQTEAAAAAKLDHPGIVPVYEVGVQTGQHFLAMAYVDGQSLSQLVQESPLEPKRAARLLQQVSEAVQYAHEHGIIHRDLKPQNILMASDGQPRVTDFGLAKHQGSDSSLTETGDVIGTPSYMPPEQASGRTAQAGPLADVYSLGATLYCLLTSRPPFQAANKLETLLQVVEQEPVRPRQLNRSVPVDLETICLKCLEKDPDRRYGTAAALAADLQRFQLDEPILARPISRLEHAWRWSRRNPAVVALTTSAALLVVIAAFSFWRQSSLREQLQYVETEKSTALTEKSDAEANSDMQRRLAAAAKTQEAAQFRDKRLHQSWAEFEQGYKLCVKNELGQGMLWFVRSLQTAPADAVDLRRVILANLAAWHDRMHILDFVTGPSIDLWAAALTPDGKRVLCAYSDGYARLLDLETEQFLAREYKYCENASQRVVARISPDGEIALTTAFGKSVQVWPMSNLSEAAEESVVVELLHDDIVFDASFSPDGRRIATACRDGKARIWFRDGTLAGPPLIHEGFVKSLAFSADGELLVTGCSSQGKISSWNVKNGTMIGQAFATLGDVRNVAVNSDGAIVAVSNLDGRVSLWDRLGGRRMVDVPADEPIYGIGLERHGRHLLIGGEYGKTRLFHVDVQRNIGQPMLNKSYLTSVTFFPDTSRVLTADHSGALKIWTLQGNAPESSNGWTARSPTTAKAFSPDGARILIERHEPSGQRSMHLWDVADEQFVGVPLRLWTPASVAHFTADGQRVALVTIDGNIWICDGVTGGPIGQPHRIQGKGITIALSPDGQRACLLDTYTGVISICDVLSGEVLFQKNERSSVQGSAGFSENGACVALALGTEVQCYLVDTGESCGELISHAQAVTKLVFSPQANRLVTASVDGEVRISEVSSGKTVQRAVLPDQRISALLVSQDERLLSILSYNPNTQEFAQRFFDTATMEPLGPEYSPQAGAFAQAFTRDGAGILIGGRGFSPGERTVQTRMTPIPLADEPERTAAWVEMITGMQINDRGVVSVLDADDWKKHRERLKELGGPPLSPKRAAAPLPKAVPKPIPPVSDPQSPPLSTAADKPVIEWIKSVGGQVSTTVNGHVTRLQIVRQEIADDDLARLNGLKQLEYLNLADTPIGDSALHHLKGMQNLRSLLIAGTRIQGPGLKSLADLKSLTVLSMGGPLVTDDTLHHLPPLHKLTNLLVVDGRITDAGLVHAKSFPSLKVLNLSGCPITDEAIETLGGLGEGRLELLYLQKTQITSEGEMRLKSLLPKCLISR